MYYVTGAVLKFGTIAVNEPTLRIIVSSIFTGIVCGILGSMFILIQTKIDFYRKHYVQTSLMKIADILFICFLTTSVFFWTPYVFNDCTSIPANAIDLPFKKGICGQQTAPFKEDFIQYNCPQGQYSPLASLFLKSQGDVIRTIIGGFEGIGITVGSGLMAIFLCIWFFFTSITYGV